MLQTSTILISTSIVMPSASLAEDTKELNSKLKNLVSDSSALKRGKEIYEQVCASCHAKDLSGGVGFNLKDGEWIHGSQPHEILSNIKTGFAKAGMPAFGSIFDDTQLDSVVAYVLSKREGFEGLSYKIYQMEDADQKDASKGKLIKSGQSFDNFADFRLPEIDQYIIEFEGDFYAPSEFDSRIWAQWGKVLDISVYSDGALVERELPVWYPSWKLKRGKQHLKISYRVGNNKLNQRNVSLIVTNDDRSIKLFPISVRARDVLSDNRQVIAASNKTVIQRKKMLELPTYSISVGLPSSVNYAFNSKQCSVVGIWQGEMLNVGPNVSGRGEDGSITMGNLAFKYPTVLGTNQAQEGCRYKGYTLNDKGDPTFSYQQGTLDFSLTASAKNSQNLTFTYKVKTANPQNIIVSLPQVEGLKWHSGSDEITQESIQITADNIDEFTLSATFN